MAFSEQDLAVIGSRFSTQRMIEQAGVAVALGRAHSEELGARYPTPKIEEIERNIARLKDLYDQQAESKFVKTTGNVPVSALVAHAKHWLADLMVAADNAFEEEPDVADKFHQGGKIGRSVPKVIGRMEGLMRMAETHRNELAAWGFGNAEITTGKKLMTDLVVANTAQEKAVRDLPQRTRELYAAKGKTYLLLKQMSRTGRAVFRNDPIVAAQFGLDVLMRNGRRNQVETPM